jgi:hypothetical protein
VHHLAWIFYGVSVDPFLANLFGQDSAHRLGTRNREFSGAFRKLKTNSMWKRQEAARRNAELAANSAI